MQRFAIPQKATEQHIIVLGKTRSGKSSAMRGGFVEPLLDRGLPVCIIDPKGDWWGLKSSADGKSEGYPVVIFGGDHADVPINEHSGGPVAELVAKGNRPCIIDLGGWMVGARTRFFVDFASTLFRETRGQRWLVIDECHNFAPQQGAFKDVNRNKMLHWANRLASEGLGRGINLIAASQRPQKVHKDFITSMETLIAMRVIHPLDRGAVKDWIDGCGDPALGKKIIGELAGMDRGEAWVWSPEIGFGPKRKKFKMFTTYDSFKPRRANEAALKGWASVDLDDVREKLAATVAEAEANDPTALKKRIIDLQNELQDARKVVRLDTPEPIEVIHAMEGEVRNMQEHCESMASKLIEANQTISVLREVMDEAGERLTSLSSSVKPVEVPDWPKDTPIPEFKPGGKSFRFPPKVEPDTVLTGGHNPGAGRTLIRGNGEDTLNGPQRRIVDALAWFESIGITEPENAAVAFMAGYSPKGGAYTNPRGSLVSIGLVEYPQPGRVKLTAEGRAIANFPASATGPELRERVLNKLNGPQQRILRPLIEAYPGRMSNEELAAAAGYSPDGGAFTNPRGSLRTLGLIEYPSPGHATARDILFPELTG